MDYAIIILAYIFVINVLAFFLYNRDKHCAVYGKRRIPEALLFFLAVIGGAFGAWMAMLMFRHKTEKPLFSIGVPIMLIINCIVYYMMGYPWDMLPDITVF